MNDLKAREYFSAYHEGSLEPALHQQFERKLQADAQLQAEYQAFVKAMNVLNSLAQEDVEVPHDLHERIMAKLDHATWEKKQAAPAGWFMTRWRSLAVGAVACAAIIGTGLSMTRSHAPTGASESGILSGTEASSIVKFENGQAMLAVPEMPNATVTISDAETNVEITKVSLDTQAVKTALTNGGSSARVVMIQHSAAKSPTYVAEPGQVRSTALTGEGDIFALAKAVADAYGRPVLITSVAKVHAKWTLKGGDVSVAPMSKLDPSTLTLETKNGALVLRASGN